jgi:hypothetical protein
MSLFGLVLLGSGPPSGLLSGWMAGQFGPRSILLLSGVSCVATAAVAAVGGRHRPGAREPNPPVSGAPTREGSPPEGTAASVIHSHRRERRRRLSAAPREPA